MYMKLPHGFLKPGQEGKVCWLLKGLYRLKQAGRGWYFEMSKVFTQYLEFKRSAINHSVLYQWMGDKHTIIAVATNDMAITSKRAVNILKLKDKIKKTLGNH